VVNIALLVQRGKQFGTLVSVRERVAHETSEYTLDTRLDPESPNDGETNSQVETLRLSIENLKLGRKSIFGLSKFFQSAINSNKQAKNQVYYSYCGMVFIV
jgi:hypothetical protein